MTDDILFWTALGLIVYTYLGFPVVLVVRGLVQRRPVTKGLIEPRVSLIIVAHNEVAIRTEVYPNPPGSPHDELLTTEADEMEKKQLEQLSLSLMKLRKKDRDLLMMRYYEELSLVEIAKRIWVGDTTVRRRLQKAEARLKEFMRLSDHEA